MEEQQMEEQQQMECCPVCLETKLLCTAEPCCHQMCSECFGKFKIKRCPLCRTYVDCLIDYTNEKLYPKQYTGPECIWKLMKEYYNEYNLAKLANQSSEYWTWTNWHGWAGAILENKYPALTEIYYYKFREELTEQLTEDQIREMYKKFRRNGGILYKDIIKKFKDFEKKRTGEKPEINAKIPKELIIKFLAYAFIVEAPVNNYYGRICEYFEW